MYYCYVGLHWAEVVPCCISLPLFFVFVAVWWSIKYGLIYQIQLTLKGGTQSFSILYASMQTLVFGSTCVCMHAYMGVH